jgi:hypothetical protein
MNNNYNSSNNAKRQNPRIDGSNLHENQPCLQPTQQQQQQQHHHYKQQQHQHSSHKLANKSQHSSPQQNIQMQPSQHQYQQHNTPNVEFSNHNNTSFFKKVIIFLPIQIFL